MAYLHKKHALNQLAKLIQEFKTYPNCGIEELLPELRELWKNAYNGDDSPPIYKMATILNRIQYKTGKHIEITQTWVEGKWSLDVQTQKR